MEANREAEASPAMQEFAARFREIMNRPDVRERNKRFAEYMERVNDTLRSGYYHFSNFEDAHERIDDACTIDHDVQGHGRQGA